MMPDSTLSGRRLLQRRYDVVVCGGGPAGVGAAVSAARGGARTLLIERLGQVGGMHTGAGVVKWCESAGGPVFGSFLEGMDALEAVRFHYDPRRQIAPGRPACDTELSKAVLLELLHDAGVEVMLFTFCKGAVLEDGAVQGVVVVNKQGQSTVYSHTVIDATADADIAASAGVPFMKGDPDDGRLQHCNFRAWWDGIDAERARHQAWPTERMIDLFQRAHADGRLSPPDHLFQPQADMFPFNPRTGELQLSSWEFEHVDPTDEQTVSRLLVQCHVATLQLVRLAREHLPGYEGCTIRKFPSLLGTRESRRIRGRYVLTADDVRSGRKFADGIARAWFYMDLHDSPPGITIPHPTEHLWAHRPPRDDWYEIPFGCLVPEDVGGLLVAGRSISTDRDAHGSTRVMATCMFTGTAAGVAAAIAVQRGINACEIDGEEVRAHVLASHECETPRSMAAKHGVPDQD